MTDISTNLEKIIEKLDGMTSETVAKNYGTDIASKVEHVSKQLDYISGGGGGSDGGNMIVNVHYDYSVGGTVADKTHAEIAEAYLNGKNVIALVDESGEMQQYRLSYYRQGFDDKALIFTNLQGKPNSKDYYLTNFAICVNDSGDYIMNSETKPL